MGPLLFTPNYIAPVWSGPRINEVRGLAGPELFGEAFDLSAHRGMVTAVRGGQYDGMPLDVLLVRHGKEILGESAANADGVIQVLLLDASQTVSVQVHPTEAYAQAHESDHEKAETWYVLDAEPGATLIAGSLTDDVSALRAAAADDTIGEKYGRRLAVSAGDVVSVSAGTMHAYGAGIFGIEIGTLGFTTYRLCDWGRGRELHVEKGFDVLDASLQPEVVRCGIFDPDAASVRHVVDHPLYEVDVVDVGNEAWSLELEGTYRVLTCVAGSAEISTPDGAARLGFTESCLVPASAGRLTVTGPCRLLVSRAK